MSSQLLPMPSPLHRPELDAIARQFAKWLHETRRAKHLSGPKLETLCGVSRQYISDLEKPFTQPQTARPIRPSLAKVDALARGLGVTIAEARAAASIQPSATDAPPDANDDLRREQMIVSTYFAELPREAQLDLLALTEALWRRRRFAAVPHNLNAPLPDHEQSRPTPDPTSPAPKIEMETVTDTQPVRSRGHRERRRLA